MNIVYADLNGGSSFKICSNEQRFAIYEAGVIGDGFGDIERGVFAAHVVGAHFAFGDDAGDGGFKTRGHVGFLEPVEHQLGGQEHRDRIDLVLAGVFRRRAVRRFEDGVFVAEVGAGREAESADQAGAQIADDVAEHVFRHEHRVILRILEHPHADGVDVRVVGANVRDNFWPRR